MKGELNNLIYEHLRRDRLRNFRLFIQKAVMITEQLLPTSVPLFLEKVRSVALICAHLELM